MLVLAFTLGTKLREIERVAVRETLLLAGFDKVAAAKSLGISRAALYAKMKRLGIPLDWHEIAEEELADRVEHTRAPSHPLDGGPPA